MKPPPAFPALDPSREALREVQCRFRVSGQCLLLNEAFGDSVLLAIDQCDLCHSSGPSTPEGAALRSSWASTLEQAAEKKGWRKVNLTVKGAISFGKSVASAVAGPASRETVSTRLRSCLGVSLDDQPPTEPCPEAKIYAGKAYCGACGCGTNPLAALDTKLLFPYLECPKQRPGFSNSLPEDSK